MICKKCGTTVKEGAKFCPHCGSKVELESNMEPADETSPQSADATEEEKTTSGTEEKAGETANADVNMAGSNTESEDATSVIKESDIATLPTPNVKSEHSPHNEEKSHRSPFKKLGSKFKALDKKVRYGIVGGGVAAIAAIGIAVAVVNPFGGVSEADVRQAFEESDYMSKGFVSQNYTNETPYELKEFEIDEETTGEGQAGYGLAQKYYGTDELKLITCSGKIANESFESTFTAEIGYGKFGNEWKLLADPSIEESDTKPLRGVDNMGEDGRFECSNISSTLDENDGEYTSTATADVTFNPEYMTTAGTAKGTAYFTFDQKAGWTRELKGIGFGSEAPIGGVYMSDVKTA